MFYIILNAFVIINILPLIEGVTVDYHKKKNITRDEVEGGIFSECGNLPLHPQPKVVCFILY
jgi:hypothetical protein